ncbi:hypothetical protein LMG23994_01695 [Cupriavidus pinatubonensis]|uniref:Uncharacterized protein n=1 Tax=Cupriavidus pinatubonensis TaxID=248026 RepID=A0ABN7YAX0_9BURK|nr:hypothetical protein LMG23994_01695 [Cupriavidus pinatubonensis]
MLCIAIEAGPAFQKISSPARRNAGYRTRVERKNRGCHTAIARFDTIPDEMPLTAICLIHPPAFEREQWLLIDCCNGPNMQMCFRHLAGIHS